ncbi:MAG TPA: hypothetical protein VFP89_14005 [Propionibacteriaceae bacterium]|nr:hypothetical protein [Propionibacteriaceae bacterium]
MDISQYVDAVRRGAADAAALADVSTRDVANRLGTAIESSTRLAIIEALSDAAELVSAELAPTSVEVRMSGPDPELIVSVPSPGPAPTVLEPPDAMGEADPAEPEDEQVARITLRLPGSVKNRVDEVADAEGISTNAWLIRAVVDALAAQRRGGGMPPGPPAPPRRIFGPEGVFGPGGILGPPGPPTGERERGRVRREHGGSGSVQGWVR